MKGMYVKKLAIFTVVVFFALAISATGIWYSLHKDRWIERYLSSSLTRDEQEFYSFNGMSLERDLSITIYEPTYKRGSMDVSATSINILPWYKTLLTDQPMPASYLVKDASVLWPALKVTGLNIEGSCAEGTLDFATTGNVKASVRGDNLVEEGYIEASYTFSEGNLRIPSLKFKCENKEMSGDVEAILKRQEQKVEVNLNFGDNAPWFRIYDDVTTVFKGHLNLKASFPPDKPIGETEGLLDLTDWGATIQRGELKSTFLFTKGTVEAKKGNIQLNKLNLELPGNGTGQIAGLVTNIAETPEYNISATCSGLKISEIVQYLPDSIRSKVEGKSIFGTIESTLEITGSPDPEPTLKIALNGIGLEEKIGETIQRFQFNSGSLTLKPQPTIILSGADLSLSGIKAQAAGNISKTKNGWTGTGRIEAKNVSLPVLGAFLPSHISSQIAALKPQGTLSTNISASLSEGLEPEIQGQVDLADLKLTLPEEAGAAIVKSDRLTLSLNGSKARLEPTVIWLATIPVKPNLKADLSIPENPSFEFSMDPVKIKSTDLLPFLSQENKVWLNELIENKQAGVNLTVNANGSANSKANKWSAKITQDEVFFAASSKTSPLMLKGFEFSVSNEGYTFAPCNISFNDTPLITMIVSEETTGSQGTEKTLFIKGNIIPAKTFFEIMPPSIHQFTAPLSPQGNLSIFGEIPLGETNKPPTLALRMTGLSFLLPDESRKKRISADGRLLWSGTDNSIHLDGGKVQAEKIVLNFSDGVIVSNVTKEPQINLTLEGKSIEANDLAAILPPFATDYIGQENIHGNLSFVSSIKGSPDQIAGIARLDMAGLSLNINTSVINLHPSVSSGEMTLKLFTKGDKVTAQGNLSKPLNITLLNSTVSINGTINDITTTPGFKIDLSSTPFNLEKIAKELKGVALAAKDFAPSGTIALGGTIEGAGNRILGGIKLSTKGIKASVTTTAGEIPIALDQGSAELSVSYSKGSEPELKLEVAEGMIGRVFNHPISIKALIDSLLGEQKITLSATSLDVPAAKIVKELLKSSTSKLLPGFEGTITKVSANINGSPGALNPTGWADLSGLSFKHPDLARPFELKEGRIALGKDYSFLWKDLLLAFGKIELHSSGDYGPSYEKGSFTNARIFSSLSLSEVPSLLKLDESFSLSGQATLNGNITGKIPLPVLDGKIAVPGNFQINITGEKKPFIIKGTGLKTNWTFDTGVGKLEFNEFEADVSGGRIKSWANLSILTEALQHDVTIGLVSIDLDDFLKTGTSIGGLLTGRLNSELSGTLTGELETLKGGGKIDISQTKLSGTKLFLLAGLNQYFPDKENTDNSIGGFLFNLAAKKIAKNSDTVKRALKIRDLLHNVFDFGLVSATIKAEDGKLKIENLKNEGGKSELRGYMTIDLKTLGMNSMFSLKLVKDWDELNVYDFKVIGTVSEPDFELPKGLESFKHIDRTPPPASPATVPDTQTPPSPATVPDTQTPSSPATVPDTQTPSSPATVPDTQTPSSPATVPDTQTPSSPTQ
jgi:hypothetical protein